MAAVSFTESITRAESFEGTPGGTIGGTGGGPAASVGSDIVYEGSQSLRRRINSTGSDFGFDYTLTATQNMTTASLEVWVCKVICTVNAGVNAQGTKVAVGSSGTAYHEYVIGDDGTLGDNGEFAYPPIAGWLILPINANMLAWRNIATTGSPALASADTFQLLNNVAFSSNGENQAMDSIDLMGPDGFFLVGGDGGDTDGRFADFLDEDEGENSTTAGRCGLWTSRAGVLFVYGTHWIGRNSTPTATATEFTDTLQSIVFPGGFVDAGYNSISIDLGASSTISLNTISITGQGRTDLKKYFDTELDVNGGTERITITGHGFNTGDEVTYSAEGGSEDIGPDATTGSNRDGTSTGALWYIRRIDVDTIELYDDPANAFATAGTTGRAALTASTAGNGESHSLRRGPDTRPDLFVTGSTGTCDLTGCILNGMRDITLTSATTFTNTQILNSQTIFLGTGILDNCIISGSTVPLGEAALEAASASDLDDIDNCSFTSGGIGHAIEITTTIGTANLASVTFTGYFAADEDTTGGWSFDTELDVTGGATDTVTISSHGFSTGDPVYYNDESGTETIGLTNQNLYWLRSVDANTVAVYESESGATTDTNRISLTASTAGNGETHKFYSANATIFNDTGGAVIINVSGGTVPTIRNGDGATTSVVATAEVTLTGLRESTEVRVYAVGTTTELAGTENATGGAFDDRTFAFSLSPGTSVDINIFNINYDPVYLRSFLIPSNDASIPISQRIDRSYNNP